MANIITPESGESTRKARPTIDQKTRAQHLFVVEGITNLSELERRLGISRPTLTKWREDYNWQELRRAKKSRELEEETSPDAIVAEIRIEVRETLAKMKAARDREQMADPELDKRIDRLTRTIARLDGMWSSKSTLLRMANDFVDFVAGRPDLKESLAALRHALPLFIEHVEKGA